MLQKIQYSGLQLVTLSEHINDFFTIYISTFEEPTQFDPVHSGQ